MRRAGARLGNVLHAQHCLALRHRVAGLADGRQPRVELVGGNRLAETGVGLVDGVPDAVDLLACECAGGDDGRIADECHAVLDALADLGFRFGAFHKIPLVQHDNHGASALGRKARHALVLVGQANRAVDYEQRNVGAVDGAHGAHEAVVLHVLVDLAFAAQARCVNDAVLLTDVDDHRIDGVARGARHIRDDGAVVIGEAVGERGLARVRAADDGDVDDVLVVFFILEAAIDFAQVIDYLVEQIARAMTVRGGDGERVAQA